MRLKCPICGPEAKSKFYSNRSGYSLLRCRSCGLVYLEEIGQKVDQDFFVDASKTIEAANCNRDSIEYWSYPEFYERYQGIFSNFFEDRWQKICKVKNNVKSLLDVGCGYGFFVEFMQKYIPVVQGIDLNDQVVKYAQSKGLKVKNCAVEDYDGSQKFDCIVMCDVLEHVIHPTEILCAIRKLLNPGGVLFLQVPNLVGFKLPTGHSWGLPHHIWQFGRKNLQRVLEKTGYKVVSWHTGVLGVIGAYERGGPTAKERLQWNLAKFLKCGNRLQMITVAK